MRFASSSKFFYHELQVCCVYEVENITRLRSRFDLPLDVLFSFLDSIVQLVNRKVIYGSLLLNTRFYELPDCARITLLVRIQHMFQAALCK